MSAYELTAGRAFVATAATSIDAVERLVHHVQVQAPDLDIRMITVKFHPSATGGFFEAVAYSE